MNKFWAILFALGTFAFIGLSLQDRYPVQDRARSGMPVGEVRTVYVTHVDRVGYRILGIASAVAGLFFVAKIRRDDLRG